MKITATRMTAALAGLWSTVGGFVTDQLTRPTHPATMVSPFVGTVLFLALTVPFFFVPVALFVVGFDYIALVFEDRGLHTPMSQLQWLWRNRQRLWTKIYQPMIVRALCWFGTASASTLLYTMWRHFGF